MMPTLVRSTLAMSLCLGLSAVAQTRGTAPPPTTSEAASKPTAPPSGPTPLMTKWTTSLSGFVEADFISDSTESYNETAGNGAISRPGTYAASHRRLTFAVRNSRIGFRLNAPEYSGIRVSAAVEADFMGNQPPNATEAQFFTAPGFRLRHGFLKAETQYVDILIGQFWPLLGFQPHFDPNTVELQGVPAAIYSRTPQIRVSHLFKADPVSVEVAVAALRPPQRDSGWPDGQAGVRLIYDGWKGVHTIGATGTAADSLSLAFSGALRGFKLPEFSATPVADVSTTSTAFSIDLLLPIIPATFLQRGNALTLNASFSNGSGFADQFTGLTGGVGFPALPGGGTYTPNIDVGTAVFAADGTLHTVDWRGVVAGLQYYLPPDGKIFISGNFSQLYSPNAASYGPASRVFNHSWWADGNLFVDVTPALRFGLEYAYYSQTYVDGVNATNHRFQFSSWYIF